MLENPKWMPPPPGAREAANEAAAAAEEAEEERRLVEAEEQRIHGERAKAEDERARMEEVAARMADEELERRLSEEAGRKDEAARREAETMAALSPDEQRARVLDKMTPQEAASVQAARSFFDRYGVELEEVGLIRSRDIFDNTFDKANANLLRLESVTENIIEQNIRWMRPQLDKSLKKIEEVNEKLISLSA